MSSSPRLRPGLLNMLLFTAPVQNPAPAKRSIKERLGNGGVRVTHAARDPRDIVDYSDVDHFAVLDFDF